MQRPCVRNEHNASVIYLRYVKKYDVSDTSNVLGEVEHDEARGDMGVNVTGCCSTC